MEKSKQLDKAFVIELLLSDSGILKKFYGTNDTITIVLQILSYFFVIVLTSVLFYV